MSTKKSYLPNLDLLRVIAAYFVLLYHFRWEGDDPLTFVFKYGYLGVYVFFCISGFITPLAMQWSNYSIRDWKKFLISRFFRLYPAFAVIAILEIILYAWGGFMGYSYKFDQITLVQVVSNFTWTAEFFKQDWFVPVFWTLAIEAQFTFVILVIYPLLKHRNELVRVATILALIIPTYFIGRTPTFFTYSAIFAMGIIVFCKHNKSIDIFTYFGLMFVAAFCSAEGISYYWTTPALFTALFITFVPQLHARLIPYFGKFAYSFFLIHITFGGAALFHLRVLPEQWYFQLLRVFLASVVSFFAAWVFYYRVEKPFHEYSRRFKAKK